MLTKVTTKTGLAIFFKILLIFFCLLRNNKLIINFRMQWLRFYYRTTAPILIKTLFVRGVASMICPAGFISNEFNNLFYELGYSSLTQICPPDNFLFSYVCCNERYFECCIRFEVWFVILVVALLISFSLCCFCLLLAGILFVKRNAEN